ncbi:hypothetical protein NDU88_008094 [Pleurodeles waltl]|uniref:Uncharacterized protein n=1 Tax=Pleurodeles waltl TaxID=8319 RepID=A0AAV7PNB0_PLEWA|nr:hypothetical protein NDU88_008094 [Pleurodeles waltl]
MELLPLWLRVPRSTPHGAQPELPVVVAKRQGVHLCFRSRTFPTCCCRASAARAVLDPVPEVRPPLFSFWADEDPRGTGRSAHSTSTATTIVRQLAPARRRGSPREVGRVARFFFRWFPPHGTGSLCR